MFNRIWSLLTIDYKPIFAQWGGQLLSIAFFCHKKRCQVTLDVQSFLLLDTQASFVIPSKAGI